MKGLMERAERIGREAAARKIDELAVNVLAKLPRAGIEKMTSGLSICEVRLLDRWLNDPELRFLSGAK